MKWGTVRVGWASRELAKGIYYYSIHRKVGDGEFGTHLLHSPPLYIFLIKRTD